MLQNDDSSNDDDLEIPDEMGNLNEPVLRESEPDGRFSCVFSTLVASRLQTSLNKGSLNGA